MYFTGLNVARWLPDSWPISQTGKGTDSLQMWKKTPPSRNLLMLKRNTKIGAMLFVMWLKSSWFDLLLVKYMYDFHLCYNSAGFFLLSTADHFLQNSLFIFSSFSTSPAHLQQLQQVGSWRTSFKKSWDTCWSEKTRENFSKCKLDGGHGSQMVVLVPQDKLVFSDATG